MSLPHRDLSRSISLPHRDLSKPTFSLIEDTNQVNPNQSRHCRQPQQQRKRFHEDSFTTTSAYYSPIVKRKRTISPAPVSCESSVSSQSSDDSTTTPSFTRTDPKSTTMLSFMSTDELNSQLCYLAGKLARSMEKSEASRSTLVQQGLIDNRRLWRNLDTDSAQPLAVHRPLAANRFRSMEKSEASLSTLVQQGLIDDRRLWRNLGPIATNRFRCSRNDSHYAKRWNAP